MLTLGKNDFEVVEAFCKQRFAHQALGLRAVPTSPTLRQRFDAMGCQWSELADSICAQAASTAHARANTTSSVP